ncbi:MAG: PEP-CTERM sorting domain-containing protein [Akkermansiaceae bacterium]
MRITHTITALAVTTMACNAAVTALDSNSFDNKYIGTDIYNGSTMVGEWGQQDDAGLSLNGSNLVMENVSANAWIQLGSGSAWATAVDNSWTIEFSMRVIDDSSPDSQTALWLDGGVGAGQRQIILVGENDITQFTGGASHGAGDNTTGFQTIRVAYDHTDGNYYIYRNGVLSNSSPSTTHEGNETGTRLIIGDCCSSMGSAASDVEIEYVRFDGDGAFSPVPEPSSTALLGLGGLALILRRRK